jgi:hypothetical protein
MKPQPTYETDFYGWAMMEAQLLRERKLNDLDFENLIEEIEDMGSSKENQLTNRLAVLIAHLLKWQFQPNRSSKSNGSWLGTIEEQRDKIKRLLKKNPSLKTKVYVALQEGFNDSKYIIKRESPTILKLLPKECPYTFEQLMDDEFFPE